MIRSYARVSTEDQHLDAQIEELEAVRAGQIFSEKISGSKARRPEIHRLHDQLHEDDVVVLSRNTTACPGLSRTFSASSKRSGPGTQAPGA